MPRATLPDGTTLTYTSRGPDHDDAPTLLFLHGWGTSRLVWEGQIKVCTSDHRVITYDARGCGDSDHPLSGYTIAQAARDALALADVIGLERFGLIGSSLGGNVALETTLLAPHRVTRLILVDAPLHWFADGLERAAFTAWLDRLWVDRFGTVEAMTPGWFGPRSSALTHRWTASLILRSTWAIDALIRDAANHDRRDSLSRVSAPVTLVHGRLDHEVPLAVPEDTSHLLPHVQLHVLDGCGHMPHLEDRAAFNVILRDALDWLR